LRDRTRTFGGLYTHSLRRTIYGHGLPVLRDNLAKTLLERQQSGELNFRDRKWHVPTVALESGPPPDLPNVDVPLRVTRPGHLPAIPADVLAGSLIGDDEEQAAIATANVGWDLFRRLIPHYVDCLHLSGATRISQYTDRWKQQFHLLRPKGPWWPDEAGPRILRIDRRDLGADFLEGLYRRRTEPLLLGYPISISHGSEDKIFVTPVTLLQCQWKVDDTALLLWPTEVAPRLNTDWVGRNRRRRDLTKMRMWLRETASGEDSGIASVGDEGWSDIPDMASSLEMFLARDVAEQLAPASLEPRLDLGGDDKIHNVLGLFLVVPNPFTIGCRRDLEAMQKLPDKDLAKTALAAVFADVPGVGSIEFAPSVASPLDLSEDQLVATINGLSHPLTVISGPPGTGKSQVVCALMISAALAGRSVLFASHSHKALDAVQERMKEIAPDHVLLARARTEDGDQNFDFRAAIDFLLGRLVDSNLEVPIAARRRAIEIRHKELQHLLDHTDELSRTTDDLGRFTEELERRRVEIDFRQTSLSGLGRRPPSLWRRLFGWLVDLWGRTKKSRVDTIDPMRVPEEKLLSDAELSRRIRGVEAKHKALTAEVEKMTRD